MPPVCVLLMIFFYLTYSNYTNPTASFFTYNIKTGKMDEASFLKDIPEKLKTSTIYMLEVNDNNGDFYIGTSEYTTNGTIYRFKKRRYLYRAVRCRRYES